MYEKNRLSQKPNLEKLYEKKSISKTEKALLDKIEVLLNLKIDRQVLFADKKIIVDGVVEGTKIVVEYDGPENHKSQEKQNKDKERDRWLLENGFSIYRLQWFEQIPFRFWTAEIERQAAIATRIINNLIKLQKLKVK